VNNDVLIRAEHVSKKFCRSLKRSLWYGAIDIATGLKPWNSGAHIEGEIVVDPPLRRDEFWAVRDVSFELKRGECLGLIGHNGAGKSSLLKILNGLIPPDAGRITTRGRVGSLIELNAGFNPVLTGRENIFNQAALLGFSRKETLAKFDAIVAFSEIEGFLDMPVQNYSSGMRVRLGFSVAAQLEPDILLIDEVLAVGDVAFRFKCLNAIGEIMRSAAVIFVSHTMPQIFRICTEVMVLDHGSVSFHGHDIGDGVGIYLSLFKNAEPTIAGSGEARVLAAALESGGVSVPTGETLRVAHASSLVLRASLHIDPSVERASVQFVLWNAEMLPVLDVMTEQLTGFALDVPESGNVEVTATLPKLELNAGKYSVSVMVNTPDFSRSLCRHDNAVYLQVEAAAASGAYVLAPGSWTATPVR
jgi:lipopolysaccharide transport system ATP-binding protein